MKFDWGYLFGMALQTVPEPRVVARDLFGLGLGRRTLWQILLLILVSMAFLGVISGVLFPVDAAEYGPIMSNPLAVSASESVVGVGTVFAIFYLGRMAGGTGSFAQALMTVVWMHFIALVIELGVLFLGVFAPGLALVLWGGGFVMTFWVLTQFVTEMHGFRSAGMVFVGILLSLLVFIVIVSVLAGVVGIGAGVAPNGGSL